MTALSLSFAANIFAPLAAALDDIDDLRRLLAKLGVVVELSPEQAEALDIALGLRTGLGGLIDAAEALQEVDRPGTAEIAPVLASALAILGDVRALAALDPAALGDIPPDLQDQDAWETALKRLPEVLLLDWLAVYVRPVYAPLFALGIVEETPLPGHPATASRLLHWDRLGRLFSEPDLLLAEHYDWQGAFKDELLLRNLGDVLRAFGFDAELRQMGPGLAGVLQPGANALPYELALASGRLPSPNGGTQGFADLVLAGRERVPGQGADGIALTVVAGHELTMTEGLGSGFTATLSVDGTLDGTIGIAVHPGGPELFGGGAALTAGVDIAWQGEEPLVLFGSDTGSRLEMTEFTLGAGIASQGPRASIRIDMGGATQDGLRVVISPGEGDGFIRTLVGEQSFELTSGFGITADSATGIRFEGGAGFEIYRSLGFQAGPIEISGLRLKVSAGTGGLEAIAAVTGGADLNVVRFLVEDIGVKASLHPMAEGETGMFGTLGLSVGFKPPTGLGLAIEAAGVIDGDAYLRVQPETGRYSGVGQIKFMKLELTAVGIIETQLPDNPDGWSLFLSVSAIFPNGLPIFPSFFLTGVGGLIGLNRTVDQDELFDRMLDGALDSIMFPADPIENAPQIIEDTAAIFPAAEGQFLFGAMFQLTWGSSGFITGNLGVVVEVPSPFRLITMGQVKARLPNPAKSVVTLNLDVVGIFDFTAATIEMTAALRDSYIGPPPEDVPDAPRILLSGGMALKATFAGRPELIFSIGGFNDDFTPPAGFRTPARISASIPVGSVADVSLSGYFAVAPGIVMAGGRIDVSAALAGFRAVGYLQVDAIIYTDPFGFDFSTEFGAAILKGNATLLSIDVSARITGPSPIEIWADATFEILGFAKTIDLHLTTEGNRPARPAAIDLAPLLQTAMSDAEAIRHGGADLPVRLTGEVAAVDPAAEVELVQTLAPLERRLDMFEGAAISGTREFEIAGVTLDGAPVPASERRDTEGWFPFKEFLDLTDEEKLARPSFEEMTSGTAIGSAEIELALGLEIAEGYDEKIIDRTFETVARRRNSKRKTSKLQRKLARQRAPQKAGVAAGKVGNTAKLEEPA